MEEMKRADVPLVEEKDRWEPEQEDDFLSDFSDESFDEDDELPENIESNDDVDKNDDGIDDENTKYFMSDELPEISEEDNQLVDDWWEKYKEMRDVVTERNHLVQFMDTYPHLVDNLGLQHEVLFELGAAHYEIDRYEEYVELLLRIRKEFPNTYQRSFGYYDADLICWYVSHGRTEEISPFFEWFNIDKKGKCHYKLDDVICFLRAVNRSDILLKEIAKNTAISSMIPVRSNHVLSRYLNKPLSEKSGDLLLNELSSEGIVTDQHGKKFWKTRFQRLMRPFTIWDGIVPKKRSQAIDYYVDITDNFAYFLHRKLGISFDCADFYSDTIYHYYKYVISENKRPNNLFCLDKQSIEKYSYLRKMGMYDAEVEQLAQFNAFYYFAAYLKTCGNITEEQKQEFQDYIIDIYQAFYANIEKSGPEMPLFKQFPLWKLED
jgi:hypothetical protein